MQSSANRFVEFVQPQWRSLHGVARQYCDESACAGDLVQEALLRAWRAFAPSSGRNYTRAWLFTIMRNVAIEWHRAANRRVSTINLSNLSSAELTQLVAEDSSEPFAALPAMSETQFAEWLDDRVLHSFGQLAPAYREVIFLSAVGELNYREISEVLDCPIGTVMSRMGRARRALRESLGDYARERRLAGALRR